MKKFRKLTAVITALCLAGSMMATMSMLNVSAVGNNSITISGFGTPNGADNNANDDGVHTYEAYQVFSGTYDATSEVLTNINWGSGVSISDTDVSTIISSLIAITPDTDKTNPFTDNSLNGITTSKALAVKVVELLGSKDNTDTAVVGDDSTVAKEFANIISKYLATTSQGTYSDGTISGLDDGYYLVQDKTSPTAPDSGSYDNTGAKTRYILKVVGGGNVQVKAKSSAPSVMKKVKENEKYTDTNAKDDRMSSVTLNTDNDKGWNDVADYNIGDTVPFRLYGSMPSTLDDYDHYFYEFQDTLGEQFDITTIGDITLKVDGKEVRYGCTNGFDFDNHKITVTIMDVRNLKDTEGNGITVTEDSIFTVDYSATLNSNAVIGLNGQENKVKLVYSNNPNNTGDGTNRPNDDDTGETPEDKVIVFTYELDITKVDGALYEAWQDALKTDDSATADTKTYLKDAEFMLYTNEGCTTEVTIYSHDKDGDNTIDEYVVWKGTGTPGTGYTLVDKTSNPLKTDTDGKIKIKGLDDGEYYLKETKAPAGYNELEVPVKLTISANTKNDQSWNGNANTALTDWDETHTNGALKLTNNQGTSDTSDDVVTYSLTTDKGSVETIIANNKGSSLPSTGGIGTTIFYMVGGVLVVGAGVTLIAKKRMKNDEQ